MTNKFNLISEEAKTLRGLEELIGSSIPQLDMNKKSPFSPLVGYFGVKIANKHVIDLRLDGEILLKINPSKLTELFKLSNLTEIFELIENFSSLQQLRLTRMRLTTLPESIENHTLLKKLDLTSNKLISLPQSIGSLSSLQELGLGNNLAIRGYSNKGNELTTLPESISKLTSLKRLYLWGNNLAVFP